MSLFTLKKNFPVKKACKVFFLSLLFIVAVLPVKAQFAEDIYTDFGGFWRSNYNSFNPVLPNKNHNVIGFSFGGINYSTGVKDSLLTANGISFTPGFYKTLPFTSISGTIPSNGSGIYVALPEQYDEVAAGFGNPLPGVNVKNALTDGVNGLNIGTGVTNLPSSANMIFPANIISTAAITDNQPDIIFAQLTSAATSADVLVFQDSTGKTVGKSNSLQWNLAKSVGDQSLDFYSLTSNALIDTAKIIGGATANTKQSMRLLTIHLSDFGITAANAARVKAFVIKPAGSSDPAFIAYNVNSIYIIPPIIDIQPQNQVVCIGSGKGAYFSVNASGLSLSYQWMKDGVNIPGATGKTYSIPVVNQSDIGGYQVVVTNPGGIQYSSIAYINITINKQPGPPDQSIVTGNNITYLVSANNATSFQWKKNGIDIPGATDSIYALKPVTVADSGTYTVSIINPAGDGCATLLSEAVHLKPIITIYSNATSDLNIPSTYSVNMDGTGSTPVDFTRAEHTFVIANRLAGNTLTNLTIAGTLDVSNAVTTIPAGTTLDVGHLIRSGIGSIAGTDGSGLTLRGNSQLYFDPANNRLQSLTMADGVVTVYSPLSIIGSTNGGRLNLKKGTLVLMDTITLKSTSIYNTSIVTTVGEEAVIDYGTKGIFVNERFIPSRRAYRYLSPSVNAVGTIKSNWMENTNNPNTSVNYNPNPGFGTHITGRAGAGVGFDATVTNNPSIYTFNPTNQQWLGLPNPNVPLLTGNAYRIIVRGSRAVNLNSNESTPSTTVLRETGKLKTGTVTVPSSGLANFVGGYSLIGNPYASPVNWHSVTKTGLESRYYAWDPTVSTRGAYVSYNRITGTNSFNASNVNQNIQPGQAVFVQTIALNPSLQFEEKDKTDNITAIFRAAAARPKLTVELLYNTRDGAENAADGFTAVFDENFSESVGEEEAFKLDNQDESIAIDRNGASLSIEGRPLVNTIDSFPIKMWQFRQQKYFLKINATNFDKDVTAFVRDRFLNKDTVVNMSGPTVVPFTITSNAASYASGRFTIIFKQEYAISENITELTAKLKDDAVELKWKSLNETNIDHYEVQKLVNGKYKQLKVVATKGNNGTVTNYTYLDELPTAGANTYRIKVVEKSGTIKNTESVTINVPATNIPVTVYPNPIIGKSIGLKLKNVSEGNYNVFIYNNMGLKVYSGNINLGKGSGNEQIQLQESLVPGIYRLELTKGAITLTSSIVFQ